MVDRSLALPDFAIPWSWSILPLRQGLGAKPLYSATIWMGETSDDQEEELGSRF